MTTFVVNTLLLYGYLFMLPCNEDILTLMLGENTLTRKKNCLLQGLILESGFGGGHFGVHVYVLLHVEAVRDVLPVNPRSIRLL
jgi:hypothetical protein